MTNFLYKFKWLVMFLWITPLILEGSSMSCCGSGDVCPAQVSVAAKAGYFFFTDSKMRKIYDKGGLDVQLCASYPLWRPSNKWNLQAYGAVEYLQRSGKSESEHQKTSLWSIPVNIGLMPVWTVCTNLEYYFAVGPRYFYLHQHNDSAHVYKNKSRNGLGFFVNTGLHYQLCNSFFLDIFGEYSFAQIRFHSGNSRVYTRKIQIGGFTFSGGLGYKF